MFQTFCNIFYYFYPLNKIPVDYIDLNLNNDFRKCLKVSYKYFNWRKYGMYLLIPFMLIDIILNFVNYNELKKNLINRNNNTNNFTHVNNTIIYNYSHSYKLNIYDFLHNRTVRDYIIMCSIIPFVFSIFEYFFIFMSICYSNVWVSSKKYFINSSYFSIGWIYLIFFVPLSKLLELSNSNELLKSYINMYVILVLLKETIPIIYNIFLGIIWCCLNFKLLYPDNIYLGQIYSVITNLYFFSIGFILLIFIQISRNYLISFFILSNLLSILLPKLCFGKQIKYIYTPEDFIELNDIIYSMRFIYSAFIILSLILIFIYTVLGYEMFSSIILIDKIFLVQFINKFVYRNIYFKILMGDIILSKLIYLEKNKEAYKEDMENNNLNFRKINRELYIENSKSNLT